MRENPSRFLFRHRLHWRHTDTDVPLHLGMLTRRREEDAPHSQPVFAGRCADALILHVELKDAQFVRRRDVR